MDGKKNQTFAGAFLKTGVQRKTLREKGSGRISLKYPRLDDFSLQYTA